MTADPHVAPLANAVACSWPPGPQPDGYSTLKSREAAAVVPVVPLVVGVEDAGAEVGRVVLDCGPDVVLDGGGGMVVGADVVDSSPREIDALSAPPQPTSAKLPNAAARPRIALRFPLTTNPGGWSTTRTASLRGPARLGQARRRQ